jgi:hypothetical protein
VIWDPAKTPDIVRSYRLQQELGRGSDADRRIADAEHWWAWEAVTHAVRDGALPLEVIDEMLHDPEADDRHRVYVAQGPIEDLLSDHGEDYARDIAERCRQDRVWAWTVGHVWLEREDWVELPSSLRALIPGPGTATPPPRGGKQPPPNRRRQR